jgi:hypothetical protein
MLSRSRLSWQVFMILLRRSRKIPGYRPTGRQTGRTRRQTDCKSVGPSRFRADLGLSAWVLLFWLSRIVLSDEKTGLSVVRSLGLRYLHLFRSMHDYKNIQKTISAVYILFRIFKSMRGLCQSMLCKPDYVSSYLTDASSWSFFWLPVFWRNTHPDRTPAESRDYVPLVL